LLCEIEINCSGPEKTADGGRSHKAGQSNCMAFQLPESCAGGSLYVCGTNAVKASE
jgi:hypothetical protein